MPTNDKIQKVKLEKGLGNQPKQGEIKQNNWLDVCLTKGENVGEECQK